MLLDKLADSAVYAKIGISYSQFLVLAVLAGQDKVPQKFVAGQLGQTQAAVSRQVDLLVGSRLVSRTRNKHSRREYVLGMTKAGQKKYKLGLAAVDGKFGSVFVSWRKEDQARLLQDMGRIIGGLRHNS